MRDATALPVALLIAAVALLAGCQAQPATDARELVPPRGPNGEPRSLAFASPQHQNALEEADLPPDLPWFADRNDLRPSVEAGVQPSTFESSYTLTIDRQHSFRGRLFDFYSETTYRQRDRETWR